MKVRGRTRSENVYVARQQSGGFRAGGGPQVKRVESMSKAYWQKRYNGARRLASMGGSDAIDVEIAEARRKLATRQ